MKLNEIKQVMKGEYDLTEGVIPVHLTMTLEQVISAGKVTNNVQHFIMAGLIGLLKDGNLARWPRDINAYPMNTNAAVIEAVKNLTPQESVEMATWLLSCLKETEAFESNCYMNQSMDYIDWMKWVLRRQD